MDGHTEADKPVAPPAETPDKPQPAPAKPEQHRRLFADVHKPAVTPKPETQENTPPAAAPPSANPAPAENLPDEMPDMASAPEENAAAGDDPAKTLDEPKKSKPAKPPRAPKPPRQPGVGLAIFATTIIILGLAALATYAYLRTNNISLI